MWHFRFTSGGACITWWMDFLVCILLKMDTDMDVSGHDGHLMSADGFERAKSGTFLQYFLRTFIHPQTTDFKQGKNLFFGNKDYY